MPDSKYYVAGAFLSGIALTVAYNRHLYAASSLTKSQDASKQQHKLLSKLSKINDLETLKKTLVELESSLAKGESGDDIKEGIEGCIGNTPLIRIKSLSEYTGCDILVKAEVSAIRIITDQITEGSCSFSTALATVPKTASLLASSKWYVRSARYEASVDFLHRLKRGVCWSQTPATPFTRVQLAAPAFR
jgi:hypothetical protein